MLPLGLALSGCSGGSATSGSGGGSGPSNPVPTVSSLSPSSATAGSLLSTLTVSGSQFLASSVVNWNGQARNTVFLNSSQLTASLNPSDINSAGSAQVTVTTPAPGGGTSSALTFKIIPPLPALSSRTDWQYIGSKVDAGEDNFYSPNYLAYDSARNQIFLSVPAGNVVEVFDTLTHIQKATISVPSPYGIDISAEGSNVYVGTGTQYVYVLDPSTLHVKQILDSTTAIPGGFSSVFVFSMSGGNLFIVPGFGVDGNGTPLIWSLATGSASFVNIPDQGAVMRTGDRSSIVVASPFTSGNIDVYNVAAKNYVTTPYVPGDIVERVASNPAKDQFAVSDLDGNIYIYNSSLALLGQIRIEPPGATGGERLNGMVFSLDGSLLHLFVDSTIQQYDTSSFTKQALMAEPYYTGTFPDPLPFAEDSTGMIFAINEEGIDFIDVSTIQNTGLKNVPFGYGYSLPYLAVNSGPLAGGTSISGVVGVPGSGTETGTITAAYLNKTPVWDLNSSGNNFSFESPSASTPGAVNMVLELTDGTPLLDPKAFSYGPDVVRLVSTTSGADGGGTGFLVGYGLGNSPSGVQITIGGKTAPVSKIGLTTDPFPTPLRSASFTIPQGVAGMADVTVTTSAGSQTMARAFQFNPASNLHTTNAGLEAGVYDATRKQIYYTTTNQILTWSVNGNSWLAPISIPNSSSAALTGISISPNGQYLAASDQGNRAIVVLNQDSPTTVKSLPVSDGGFGLQPASVAVSNQGKIYFNLAFTYRGGSGTRCQQDLVWELDATSGATTDLAPSGLVAPFCMSVADRLLLSTDGTTLFLNDEGGLALFDVPSGKWNVLLGPEVANSDMALSGDNSRLFVTFNLIDSKRGYLGTPAWSDLDFPDNQTLVLGEKLDRNGSVLLQPWSNALDLVDLSHLVKQQRIPLSYPLQAVFDPLVWDDDNDTAYLIVSGGMLEVPLTPPLIVQASSPDYGLAGALVTLLGSGFKSSDTATVDGVSVSLNVIDEHTATIVTPAHPNGAAVITVSSSDGRTSTLDPGFFYGASFPQPQSETSGFRGKISTLEIPYGHTVGPKVSINNEANNDPVAAK